MYPFASASFGLAAQLGKLRIFKEFVYRVGNGERQPLLTIQETAPEQIILQKGHFGPQKCPKNRGPPSRRKRFLCTNRRVTIYFHDNFIQATFRVMVDRN